MENSLSYKTSFKHHTEKVSILLCTLGFISLFTFREILLRTVKSWISPEGAYGLLIFVFSVFMIWNRKKRLVCTVPTPAIMPGLLVVISGAAIQMFSMLSNTLILQGIALVITILGLIWMILGWPFLRLLAVPIGYLAFMFSFFEELLGMFSDILQVTASHMAGIFLKLLGIPVFVSGEFIQLPHIVLEVAKVCNGVNHIIALVALAIPVAVTMFSSAYQKFALVALAFVAGLFANALRVTLIGIWTIKYGQESIHGPFELLYVSFIFVVGIVFIGIVTIIFRKMGWARSDSQSMAISDDTGAINFISKLRKAPILWAVVVFAALVTHQTLFAGQSVDLVIPLKQFPDTIGQWKGRDVEDRNWPLKNLTGDQLLRRIYIRDGRGTRVGMAIAYFARQKQGKEAINQGLMWLHLKAELVEINLGENSLWVNRGKPRGIEDQTYEGDNRIFYFFYYVNGKILTNPFKAKWEGMRSELFKGTSEAALVVFSRENENISGQADSEVVLDFMMSAIPEIVRIISNDQYLLYN